MRDGRQLYARNGALAVEGFDEALREILCRIRESLCPHEAAPPVAELHSLNVYGRGGHFVAHKDTERRLPIEFHADFDQSDDVTWLVRPPWISRYGEPADGRPDPAVELLGETEYSATDYFGNEGSDVSFYAAAAILFDVPPESARKRAVGD